MSSLVPRMASPSTYLLEAVKKSNIVLASVHTPVAGTASTRLVCQLLPRVFPALREYR